jgi:hypothetical protein
LPCAPFRNGTAKIDRRVRVNGGFCRGERKIAITTDPGIELASRKFSDMKRDVCAGYLSQAAMRATASRISSAERA